MPPGARGESWMMGPWGALVRRMGCSWGGDEGVGVQGVRGEGTQV